MKQNEYAPKHATPEHKAKEIRLEAVKQNEYALKHEATQAGLRGGVVPEGRPQDFSTRRDIPPVHTASPKLPGDALGVPGGGGVLGTGNREARRPLHLRVIGKSFNFAPPASPGLLKNPKPFNTKPPGALKAPPFSSPFLNKTHFPAHPLLLCCRTDTEPKRHRLKAVLAHLLKIAVTRA